MPPAMNPSQESSSTTLSPAAGASSAAASVRPRNRRFLSTEDDTGSPPTLSSPNRTPSRGTTPIPSTHIGSVTGRNNAGADVVRNNARAKSPNAGRGLLGASWAPSWASVQDLAATLLTGGTSATGSSTEGSRARSREASKTRKPAVWGNGSWGPEPPNEARPRPDDIAAGSLAKREAALKAMRTASVLESHDGVNGGLDVSGRFKKRRSDENLRGASGTQETDEYLAYIHHVQTTDTYAGIVLRYRCREDAFRKANGLWSRDNIQIRKWLAVPVEACEVKGRPCDPPATSSARVDLLSRTPDAAGPLGRPQDDFFSGTSSTGNGHTPDPTRTDDPDTPWTHVRWVSIDSYPHPVEVARVPRKALGYFPPRRKKSLLSASTLSTPRASTDLPGVTVASDSTIADSPRSASSRRPSLLNTSANTNRGLPLPIPPTSSTTYTTSASSPRTRTRLNSSTSTHSRTSNLALDTDPRPAWMRRPGGVGSLGRHVRAPGPEGDYFNAWTQRHLPGLALDASLPSMSVMGSESARFGFGRAASGEDEDGGFGLGSGGGGGIVESPFLEDGRAIGGGGGGGGQQGTGLDKAAAAIETWLRGAFERARQVPLTPVLGPRGRSAGGGGGGGGVGGGGGGGVPDMGGDLIELADTSSDDGRHNEASAWDTGGLLSSVSGAGPTSAPRGSASGTSSGQWSSGVRGRGNAVPGSKKAD